MNDLISYIDSAANMEDAAMDDQQQGSTIEAVDHSDELISERSDSDSGYGEHEPSTASLRSSIFDYEEEYGRSYHAFRRGKYVMPNDEREQDRMDIHYHSLRITMNDQLYISPIENPGNVVDMGTGTGIWAMDFADDYPASHVIGVDLSPMQPTAVPPNLEFQIMDADESWDFHMKFDLVHTRLMNGFSIRSWSHFYEQAFEHMNPGGWVENQEFDLHFTADDGTMSEEGAVRRWENLWNEGIAKLGPMTARCYPEVMKRKMEEAGFINCTIRPYKMPCGIWPKDKRLRQAGLFNMVGMCDGLSGLSVRTFTHGLGWSVEQMEVLLMEVRNEWKDKRIHSYLPIYVVYGQKPA